MAELFKATARNGRVISSFLFAAVVLATLPAPDAVQAQPTGDVTPIELATPSPARSGATRPAAPWPLPAGTRLQWSDRQGLRPGLFPHAGEPIVQGVGPTYELSLLLKPGGGSLLATLQLRGTVDAHWPANPDVRPLTPPPPPAVKPVPASPAAPRADIFGSVAFKASRLAISPVWQAILAQRSDRLFTQGCAAGETVCGAPSWRGWLRLYEEIKGLRGAERMQWVNERANLLIRQVSDEILYGKPDHWADLAETVVAGAGDCEDFAIAKMWLLAAVGIPLSDMQLVVLRDTARGVDHAVLAVREGGETYVLDSATDGVRRAETIHHYRPVYTVSAGGSWLHGFRSAQNRAGYGPKTLSIR